MFGTRSRASTTFCPVTAEGIATLDGLANDFADKLTSLTRGVLGPDSPRFHAVRAGRHLRVAPVDDSERVCRIPLYVAGEPHLSLYVCYYCCWDGSSTFIATDRANIKVFYGRVPDPLLRFEYDRSSQEPPGAHIQVHAHRDEMAFLMRLADSGRPGQGFTHRKLPRLSELRFPVGGHRMRPALEDVLLFLHREFSIEVAAGWRSVLDEHLRDWRRVQLRSAVRDAPEEAVATLRKLGYTVLPPQLSPPRSSPEANKLFWP